jgi:tRNA dimethylallyltransferase
MRSPIFLAGPTAVGKSEIVLELAERICGEIISVDSMQVYRGLDIGTAKPGPKDRERVPHHLLDVVDLKSGFDAAQFVDLAEEAVKKITDRGGIPIFCGGTGLYFKAWLEGLGEGPASAPELRHELEQTPLEILLRELQEKDPQAFTSIDRMNPRRVIRAVEVIRLTGKPFSAQRSAWRTEPGHIVPNGFTLLRGRDDLTRRIDERVDRMFASGLLEETTKLLKQGLAENRTAMQAIGYRQAVEHLQGLRDLSDTIALVKTRTRKFAKRQMTWYSGQLKFTDLNLGPEAEPDQIAAMLAEKLRATD